MTKQIMGSQIPHQNSVIPSEVKDSTEKLAIESGLFVAKHEPLVYSHS